MSLFLSKVITRPIYSLVPKFHNVLWHIRLGLHRLKKEQYGHESNKLSKQPNKYKTVSGFRVLVLFNKFE
jgi:hypothetical protein